MKLAIAAHSPHEWNDFIGHAICAWTRSPYSHVELVIDGICYSSSLRDGGVRAKRINLYPHWWRVIPIEWASADFAKGFFESHLGAPYGYADLIGQHVVRLPWHDPNGWICSEICAAALELSRPHQFSPGSLVDYVLYRNAEHRNAN